MEVAVEMEAEVDVVVLMEEVLGVSVVEERAVCTECELTALLEAAMLVEVSLVPLVEASGDGLWLVVPSCVVVVTGGKVGQPSGTRQQSTRTS